MADDPNAPSGSQAFRSHGGCSLRRAALREALGELTERERQVLILRLYLDLTWSDVAGIVGLTEAGARTRYYRALKRLRLTRGSQEVLT